MDLPISGLRLATGLPVMVRLLVTALQLIQNLLPIRRLLRITRELLTMGELPAEVVLLQVKADLQITAEALHLPKELPILS